MAMIRPLPASPLVVVVAEDEVLTRMAAIGHLMDAGFRVLEAQHATEALSILRSRAADIHILFTDVHMPGPMNGLALSHHVSEHWPWIALLIASGEAHPAPSELPNGSRFMPKPYDLDYMLTHVRELTAIQ